MILPGESRGQGSLAGCRLWGRTESDATDATQQQQQQHVCKIIMYVRHHGLPRWALPDVTGDARGVGSIPGSGRSPEGGNGNPLQYSCLENPMDRQRVGNDLSTELTAQKHPWMFLVNVFIPSEFHLTGDTAKAAAASPRLYLVVLGGCSSRCYGTHRKPL